MNANIIEIQNLVKTFDGVPAVGGISLQVNQGDVFGFIGPNGAGKTTTIRILATLLEPDAGCVKICGIDVIEFPEDVRRIIGFMPDYFGVYESISVYEYLDFFGAAYGIKYRKRQTVLEDIMELTDLTTLRDKLMGALSKGMRQRVCLAKTLIHDPKVLILDEPASGLDPRARIEFRALLKELCKMGKTIFISSHILTELADVCTKVGILEKGKLVACGTIDDVVKASAVSRRIILRVAGRRELAKSIILKRPEVLDVAIEGEQVVFRVSGMPDVPALVKELALADVPICGVEEEKSGLEDVFMRVTRGEVA